MREGNVPSFFCYNLLMIKANKIQAFLYPLFTKINGLHQPNKRRKPAKKGINRRRVKRITSDN